MGDSMKEVVETLDPVARRVLPQKIYTGTLVPLKTTLELRDNLTLGLAYVTRAPTKCTNDVVNVARALAGDDMAKNLPHLRRCSKPGDLPPHLKSQFMNEGQTGRSIHVGKSQWLYIMLGSQDEIPYEELIKGLATIDDIRDDIFVGLIPVPLLAPTSQVQANMWSQQFWQTVYRKNNPLGPHPSNICRTSGVVARDASVWMTLAHQVAKASQKAGCGEPVGAVIVKRSVPMKPGSSVKTPMEKAENGVEDATKSESEKSIGDGANSKLERTQREALQQTEALAHAEPSETTTVVAVAGDARWHRQEKIGHTGNPMAHAALRAISMVAQKLVRSDGRDEPEQQSVLEFEGFQDKPLFPEEEVVYEADHPSPDGYLCHELELYMTHEPCTMCAMAILHSRMGRIVYRQRMPLTGGMSSEDRGDDLCGSGDACENAPCGGGQGLGLHWRKELNWSMLGWEWETDEAEVLAVNPHVHV